jgi:F0F1-type ATP synthase delta subunit
MQSRAKTYAAVMVQVLHGASEQEAAQKIQRFKRILYKQGDFKNISKILQEFSRAWFERNGKQATVVTAQPLAEKTRVGMQKQLKRAGYVLQERVDSHVIGGTALYLGNDYVIDNTIRGKLQRFSKTLYNNG